MLHFLIYFPPTLKFPNNIGCGKIATLNMSPLMTTTIPNHVLLNMLYTACKMLCQNYVILNLKIISLLNILLRFCTK